MLFQCIDAVRSAPGLLLRVVMSARPGAVFGRAARPSPTISCAGMRLHITRIGWPQTHRQAARSGAVGLPADGAARRCRTCSNRIDFALLGCRKPKLRERRKPLGSTCWSTSHRKSAPGSVRSADLHGYPCAARWAD